MPVIALYNLKGGVGKTAAAVNLAYLAARSGGPVLLCDLDPQGSASYYFRIQAPKKLTAGRFLQGGKQIDRNIRATDYANLDLLPSSFSLRNLSLKLHAKKKPRARLAKILKPLGRRYAMIFLDCPPSINLESENVFHAARLILVPFIPTTLSLVSYNKLIDFVDSKNFSKQRIVPFFSLVDRRKRLHKDMITQMHASSNDFLQTEIPYSSEIEKMGLQREPIVASRPHCRASIAFQELWQEVTARI